MKKKLLALVCFVLLISILLCSCNIVIDRRPDGEDTKQSSNTDPKKPESTKNTTNNTQQGTSQGNENNSGKIEKLNGKSARDIVKSFFDTYSTITSVDMISYNFIVSEGVSYEETQELKLYGSNIYMRMSSDGEEMKIWHVGGMMYIDAYGEKAKVQMDIEDYFGASISDILTSTIPTDLPSLYLAEFNSSQIYKSGSTYYFTAKFSAQEAYEIYRDYGAEFGDVSGFSETFYCDENGTIKSIVTSNDDGSSNKIVFNSYGQYVSIPTPENSHLFVEMDIDDLYPDNGGGTNSGIKNDLLDSDGYYHPDFEDIYGVYLDLCDTLASAYSYYVQIMVNGKQEFCYDFAGEEVYLDDTKNKIEQWIGEGKMIVRKSSGMFPLDTNDPKDVEAFFDRFAYAEEFISGAYEVVSDRDIIDCDLTQQGYGEYTFECMVYDDYYDIKFSYKFDNTLSKIVCEKTVSENGEVINSIRYNFLNVNLLTSIYIP